MTAHADVVVVGAGITGAATAYALSAAGRRVTVLEQFEPGHGGGSSHGSSRIFRLAYPEPEYVGLARESRERWEALERECGEPLLLRTGTLDVGVFAATNAAALDDHGIGYEQLTGAEASRRWAIALADEEEALFQPDGGITLADRALHALLTGATRRGAEIRPGCRVTSIDQGDAVRVRTAGGDEYVAAAAVVTAGSWAPGLLGAAGIELPVQVTRETVAYFPYPEAATLPPLLDDAAPEALRGSDRKWVLSYALAAPGVGLKAGLHQSGAHVTPDEPAVPDPAVVDWVTRWAERRYPGLVPEPLALDTCLYTSTDDDRFLLERHDRIVVGSACSGHGFKFAPVVGERLAALAEEVL